MKIKKIYNSKYSSWLKNINKLLVFGMLYNSMSTNSFAGILSDDTRYETFIKDDIIVNDILEEDKTTIKLKGTSLVNSIGKISHLLNDGVIKDNSYSFVYSGKNARLYFKNSTIKENTTYTIFGNIIKNTLTRTDSGNQDNVMKLTINNNSIIDSGFITIKKGQTGLFSRTVTTGVQNSTPYLEVAPNATYEIGGEFEIKDIMVVEGDYSYLNLDYFEGLQSSFENQIVTQEMIDSGEEESINLGKYKVQYKSSGKNKFDGNLINRKYNTDTGLPESVGKITANLNPIKVSPNTTYYINRIDIPSSSWTRVFYYDNNMNFISNTLVAGNNSFTTPENARYINFHIDTQSFLNDAKIQIEKGSVATNYQSYKEYTNTFYLNSPLLEKDTIEIINGQAVHVKRCEKVILDGSQSWIAHTNNAGLNIYNYFILVENKKPYGYTLNDSMEIITAEEWQNVSKIGIINGSTGIGIGSDKSTLNDFKNWLSENPVTVVYELENPIYEPINTDLSINLFEANTYVSNNSNTPTNMEVTVDRVLNRAVEYTELAKANPTINSISQARYWTNLPKESIKKDELQNEINNITNISDLQIEKKLSSSNSDIYINPKNTLSVSLDTNNILFNDITSTEDVEKLKALNITVSSSLPYDLNACMPTEFYNNDKSNSLNRLILNIKDNTESIYQNFVNNTDKITLKSNCNAGVENNHSIDFMINGGLPGKADVYKTTIKFEVMQK